MSLVDVELPDYSIELPDEVEKLIREADLRIRAFFGAGDSRRSGFIPSDYAAVYRALHSIAELNLAPAQRMCEWGSGFGVNAALASMLEFEAFGIEIEPALVAEARRLAGDFGLPVTYVQGSFIPNGAEGAVEELYSGGAEDGFWMVTDSDDAYAELEFDPDHFDLVFVYPWPDEDHVMATLFDRYGGEGALLLTHHRYGTVRLRRKVSG